MIFVFLDLVYNHSTCISATDQCLFFYFSFFVLLFLGSNQYWAGRVYDLYVHFMTGVPEDSTESGSGEAVDPSCDPWFRMHSNYPLHHGDYSLSIS